MKRELIEDSIQKYQDLLDDEEHFQRLRNFFLEQRSNNGKNGSEKELKL